MSYKIEISEKEARPTMSIRTRTPVEGLPKLIGEGYGKIAQYLAQIGEQPVSEPFTAYYNMDMQDLDVEIGFPVRSALPGTDEIVASEIPAGLIVSSVHKGPYSAMEGLYDEMAKWIAENGYVPAGVSYEFYYNSPAEVPESELLTRVEMPVTKK